MNTGMYITKDLKIITILSFSLTIVQQIKIEFLH